LENLKAGKYLLIALKDLNKITNLTRRKKRLFIKHFITIPNDTVYELEFLKHSRLKLLNQISIRKSSADEL
jgi:hypothetical protein